MSLKEQLFADLKEAMKSKDIILKDTIQLVRASILQIEKDSKIQLNDDGVIKVITKEIKKYSDVLPDFQKGNRLDLIDETNRKLMILKSYLPEQLNEDELSDIVLFAIKECDANSLKDMGKVMSLVSEKVNGRADGKTISTIVKKLLQNQ